MRKYLCIKHIVILFLLVFNSAGAFANNQISYTFSLDYNKLRIGLDTLGGETYTTVEYDNLLNYAVSGKPSLPMNLIKFSVPYNAKNLIITTTVNDSIINIAHPVIPTQDYIPLNDTVQTNIVSLDSIVYGIGSCYPINKCWIQNDGFMAGENRIVTASIMPIRFMNTLSGYKLVLSETLAVNLQYDIAEPDENLNKYPIIRRDLSMREKGYEITQSFVVNPSDVINNSLKNIPIESLSSSYFASFPISSFGNHDSNECSIYYPMYDYLIITTDTIKPSLKRIAAYKRQKGLNVGIITVDQIINKRGNLPWYYNVGTKIAENDSAGIIREYLKYALCIGKLEYVLLAGKDVPYKYGWHNTIPTDQYYVDLSSDWQHTMRDSESELFVGRILAKNNEQINNYTDKLLRYELNPGNGDYSYLKRSLYTNGVDQNIGTTTFQEAIRNWTDSIFPIVTLMEEDRQNHSPSGTQIINEINNTQYGFISFNNHGSPMGIITYGRGGSTQQPYYWLWALEDKHAPIEATYHVNDDTSSGNGLNNMNNKYYPSICFSTACSVMPFDIYPPYSLETVNFGEAFTTGKDYGGPAFLGNTRDNGFDAAILQSKVAKKLIQETNKIGKALALAKSHSYNSQGNEIQNLLGDPDLEIWTDIPNTYSDINVTRTSHSISLSGLDPDSTIVTIYSNNGFYQNDTTTRSIKTYYVSPNSSIMLHNKNYIPFIVPAKLQNFIIDNSQYVIASDVVAGNHIDLNRAQGDVIVINGVEYEIEASGQVRLEDGFKVEKGAKFAVYQSCLR